MSLHTEDLRRKKYFLEINFMFEMLRTCLEEGKDTRFLVSLEEGDGSERGRTMLGADVNFSNIENIDCCVVITVDP